jgi:hypothetical protein
LSEAEAPIASGVPIYSSATFALNAALCFFRVRFMSCYRAIRAF